MIWESSTICICVLLCLLLLVILCDYDCKRKEAVTICEILKKQSGITWVSPVLREERKFHNKPKPKDYEFGNKWKNFM
jgi:hypothetical protein